MTTNYVRFELRQDESVSWELYNPILLLGEPGYDSTNNQLRIGNGLTGWNYLQPVAGFTGATGPAGSSVGNTVVPFTTSGTYTYTVAGTAGSYIPVVAEMWGGGGGGGSGYSLGGGGGGGSSGQYTKTTISVLAGSTLNIIVGAGGDPTGSTDGEGGPNGGNTSVGVGSSDLVVIGGQGGSGGINEEYGPQGGEGGGAPGAYGGGGGGGIVAGGGGVGTVLTGQAGNADPDNAEGGDGAGFPGGAADSLVAAQAGGGGGGGTGGGSGSTDVAQRGGNGSFYGAGGGGGSVAYGDPALSCAGGIGADGAVILTILNPY